MSTSQKVVYKEVLTYGYDEYKPGRLNVIPLKTPDGVPIPMMGSTPRETDETLVYNIKFRDVIEELYRLARGSKTSDYGETWNKLGLMGLYVKIMIKEGRLNNLVWNQETQTEVKHEGIRDTLLDLAAYSIYSVVALDEGNLDGSQERNAHYRAMMDELTQRLNSTGEKNAEHSV